MIFVCIDIDELIYDYFIYKKNPSVVFAPFYHHPSTWFSENLLTVSMCSDSVIVVVCPYCRCICPARSRLIDHLFWYVSWPESSDTPWQLKFLRFF